MLGSSICRKYSHYMLVQKYVSALQLIKNLIKEGNLPHICRHHCSKEKPVKRATPLAFISCRRRLMKATVLAESSILYFIFSRVLSATVMSTDVSQVGVTLFPPF